MKLARLVTALAACALLFVPMPARARQAAITVTGLQAAYEFGVQMSFTLQAESSAEITSATLFVEIGVADRVSVTEAEFTPGRSVAVEVVRDLQTQPLRPFSQVAYWWRIADASGGEVTTDRAAIQYEDNRFDWQTVERRPIVIHWYEGDLAFAQAAADAGAIALPGISRDLGVAPPERVDVYVYEKADDLRAGLALGGRTWVGGHADPDLGVVFVAVPPGPDAVLGFERDLPHELTHVLIYELTGPNYHAVPFWLNEGLAVLHETEPNPVYRLVLDRAYQSESLLPIASLCGAFPFDAADATLAYAQSQSLVSYIRDRWGAARIIDLLNAYADAASCEGGTQRVLGTSLAALESDWRRDALQVNPLPAALRQFGPWVLLLLIPALALFSLLFVPRRPPRPQPPG